MVALAITLARIGGTPLPLPGGTKAARFAGAEAVKSLSRGQASRDPDNTPLANALEEARQTALEFRKAAARDKLALAREKLRALRMFGGDAVMATRQSRQISQDIRAAAKSFAAALKEEGTGDLPSFQSRDDGPTPPLSTRSAEQDTGAPDTDTSDADTSERIIAWVQDLIVQVEEDQAKANARLRDGLDTLRQFTEGAQEAYLYFQESTARLPTNHQSDATVRSAGKAVRAMFNEIRGLASILAHQPSVAITNLSNSNAPASQGNSPQGLVKAAATGSIDLLT